MNIKELDNIQAESQEAAIQIAAKELLCNPSQLKAIPTTPGTFNVFVKQSPALIAKEYLENIFKTLDIDLKIEFRTLEQGKLIVFNLETSENAFLIGNRGNTLHSLAVLTKIATKQFCEEQTEVVLDISGYLAKRKTILEILATKEAKKVLASKASVELKNLNSYERHIIHEKLSDWKKIQTHSHGEGKDRVLTISFVENKKPTADSEE